VLALIFSLITSRSVSRPLRQLVAQLRSAEKAGELPHEMVADRAVSELEILVDTLNRVSSAARLSREELMAAKDAAEAGNRAKSDFMSNISHELRTPMNGVIGMTDLLLMTELDEEQRECAMTVHQSADSLMALINEVLDFSSLEANAMRLSCAPFDLRGTLKHIAQLLGPQAFAKGLYLTLHSGGEIPGLCGDAHRITQIFTNLIGNAIKFTGSGGVDIKLQCRERTATSSTIEVAVMDTGIGIPADKLETIFDRFNQVEGHLSRRYQGTGLGLTIARELVQLMGGTVIVESRMGEGSTFRVTLCLPLDPGPQAEPERRPACQESLSC
jgi:signal transduction histidine kinase